MPKTSKSGLPTARQLAVDASNTADRLNLGVYRKPFDLRQGIDVHTLTADLQALAEAAGIVKSAVALPEGDGVYYLMLVKDGTGADADEYPVLIREANVPYVLFGMGLMDSLTSALQLCPDPEMLPLDRL
jgi:hypothetical protein